MTPVSTKKSSQDSIRKRRGLEGRGEGGEKDYNNKGRPVIKNKKGHCCKKKKDGAGGGCTNVLGLLISLGFARSQRSPWFTGSTSEFLGGQLTSEFPSKSRIIYRIICFMKIGKEFEDNSRSSSVVVLFNFHRKKVRNIFS